MCGFGNNEVPCSNLTDPQGRRVNVSASVCVCVMQAHSPSPRIYETWACIEMWVFTSKMRGRKQRNCATYPEVVFLSSLISLLPISWLQLIVFSKSESERARELPRIRQPDTLSSNNEVLHDYSPYVFTLLLYVFSSLIRVESYGLVPVIWQQETSPFRSLCCLTPSSVLMLINSLTHPANTDTFVRLLLPHAVWWSVTVSHMQKRAHTHTARCFSSFALFP